MIIYDSSLTITCSIYNEIDILNLYLGSFASTLQSSVETWLVVQFASSPFQPRGQPHCQAYLVSPWSCRYRQDEPAKAFVFHSVLGI
jgi:hypothetical protein